MPTRWRVQQLTCCPSCVSGLHEASRALACLYSWSRSYHRELSIHFQPDASVLHLSHPLLSEYSPAIRVKFSKAIALEARSKLCAPHYSTGRARFSGQFSTSCSGTLSCVTAFCAIEMWQQTIFRASRLCSSTSTVPLESVSVPHKNRDLSRSFKQAFRNLDPVMMPITYIWQSFTCVGNHEFELIAGYQNPPLTTSCFIYLS